MAATFDTAIPDLVAVAEGAPDFGDAQRACVVRDLHGRVRLVLDGPPTVDLDSLETALRSRLGPWFRGPILCVSAGTAAERRLAVTMLGRAAGWPPGWPRTRTDPTGARIDIGPRWLGYQRVLSKQAWLDSSSAGGAWSLAAGSPAIAAFYSFKGGVGRSTLLGVIAWQLAKAGRKVVCLDLDLEAPGLSGLFEVTSEESVIDHLLTHAATGKAPSGEPVTWVDVRGARIGVVPAGRMERGYIEKLARLDYLGASTAAESPVARALAVLLERIRGRHNPDFILLDCRAGLHDLGGLSLTDVAHVDVLVGRDTPQGRAGLALTLEVLGQRRTADAQRVVVVQTFVPLDPDVARFTHERFETALYEACAATLYAPLDELPAQSDTDRPHHPWPVGNYDELALCQRLADVSPGTLGNDAFVAVRGRIEALAAPEEGPPAQEGTDDLPE